MQKWMVTYRIQMQFVLWELKIKPPICSAIVSVFYAFSILANLFVYAEYCWGGGGCVWVWLSPVLIASFICTWFSFGFGGKHLNNVEEKDNWIHRFHGIRKCAIAKEKPHGQSRFSVENFFFCAWKKCVQLLIDSFFVAHENYCIIFLILDPTANHLTNKKYHMAFDYFKLCVCAYVWCMVSSNEMKWNEKSSERNENLLKNMGKAREKTREQKIKWSTTSVGTCFNAVILSVVMHIGRLSVAMNELNTLL